MNKLFQIGFLFTFSYSFYRIIKFINKQFLKRNVQRKRFIDLIGNTPLIYIESLSKLTGCEIYGKCEFMNPGGSMKDRTCKQIILDAINQNKLNKKNKYIYEGTSGSTGISLSQIANSLGFRTKIYIPDDTSQDKIEMLRIMKSEIQKVRPCSIVDSQHYCKLAESESKKAGGFYSDQFENFSNFKVHYNETGPEIYQQTNEKINIFISGSGTGGTIAGVSQYLKSKNKDIKVILADVQGSSLHNKVNYGVCYTNQEAEGHRLKHPFDTITEGIGLNRLTKNFSRAKIDKSYLINDIEALHMSHFLIYNEGLFLGSSSAVNLCAAVKAAKEYGKGKTIVCVLCDSGMRYVRKYYNQEYLDSVNIGFQELNVYNDISFIK